MSIVPSSANIESPVLIVGAGGGFDFMSGTPIGFELAEQGMTVHYANYSFTDLDSVQQADRINDYLLAVTSTSYLSQGDYFPELLLCRWFKERFDDDIKVYCLDKKGVNQTLESYNHIIAEHGINTVICIDGGVDGIFRGDECDMGTPSMDSISVIATSLCNAKHKIFTCTAFGTEGAEGNVSHGLVLKIMSNLIRQNAMLGVGIVLKTTGPGQKFYDLLSSIKTWVPPLRESVILNSIESSMKGKFGRQNVHAKTNDKKPWISPLTCMYWYFEAEAVAKMKYFYDGAVKSDTVKDVADALQEYRDNNAIDSFLKIPI